MDTLTRINWTLAKILLAVLLSAVLLGGIATVGMVGYVAYKSSVASAKERELNELEAKMRLKYDIRRID